MDDERISKWPERLFLVVCWAAIGLPLGLLLVLLADVFIDGLGRIDWTYLSSFPSRKASEAGLFPAVIGSFYLIALTATLALPIGVGAALYLEEYADQSAGWARRLSQVIEVNIANLAGVPSVIYGLLGLGIFVRTAGFGRSLMAGASTMALLILPIIIMAAREAVRAVPDSLREASYALGATKWQTIRGVILPVSIPGIMTGTILAVSRAIGETAPLIVVGAATYMNFLPDSPASPFTALPIQIFNWISRPDEAFAENAAAGIVVLMSLLLVLNGTAIYLRNRYQYRFES